jgi:hypothetical protein
MRDFNCDVFTPNPALNMSVARRSRSNETWILVWNNWTSPKETFLIHKPTVGKTAAMAYALIKNQSK